jgi:hypothetical protein
MNDLLMVLNKSNAESQSSLAAVWGKFECIGKDEVIQEGQQKQKI